MLLGDFNAYFKEDTIELIEDAGYENLQLRLDDPYSYVFDGQTGSLDYIFASDSLADQVTGVTEWHINADEADALDYNTDFGRDPSIFDADMPRPRLRPRSHSHRTQSNGGSPRGLYTATALHFSDFEAGLLRRQTAPAISPRSSTSLEDEHAKLDHAFERRQLPAESRSSTRAPILRCGSHQ